jgi:hypothetical protein
MLRVPSRVRVYAVPLSVLVSLLACAGCTHGHAPVAAPTKTAGVGVVVVREGATSAALRPLHAGAVVDRGHSGARALAVPVGTVLEVVEGPFCPPGVISVETARSCFPWAVPTSSDAAVIRAVGPPRVGVRPSMLFRAERPGRARISASVSISIPRLCTDGHCSIGIGLVDLMFDQDVVVTP